MPHAFGDDERVAAEGHRDVVMPTREAPSFEVVETKLALEIFVDALGPPPLHHDADELSLRHARGRVEKTARWGLHREGDRQAHLLRHRDVARAALREPLARR